MKELRAAMREVCEGHDKQNVNHKDRKERDLELNEYTKLWTAGKYEQLAKLMCTREFNENSDEQAAYVAELLELFPPWITSRPRMLLRLAGLYATHPMDKMVETIKNAWVIHPCVPTRK